MPTADGQTVYGVKLDCEMPFANIIKPSLARVLKKTPSEREKMTSLEKAEEISPSAYVMEAAKLRIEYTDEEFARMVDDEDYADKLERQKLEEAAKKLKEAKKNEKEEESGKKEKKDEKEEESGKKEKKDEKSVKKAKKDEKSKKSEKKQVGKKDDGKGRKNAGKDGKRKGKKRVGTFDKDGLLMGRFTLHSMPQHMLVYNGSAQNPAENDGKDGKKAAKNVYSYSLCWLREDFVFNSTFTNLPALLVFSYE
ncbi:unnamed protein product [Caenorhabditis angaria]|uniref:Uncharacterized protein n=1 Tax=Caenorhabditis angaria TaxID=860376 RepID=A0A9P1IM95_9PELO|nr:unnamed protein product [Caenorhabditis angaria]